MDWTVTTWVGLRILRWGAWLWLLVYSVLFVMDRSSHFDSFNQVLHTTEAVLFGCGLVAVFAGMLELMMRERAGYARPSVGQIWPPRVAS